MRFPADPPALNAISPFPPAETEDERKARHLRMARELAELGMTLARAAANQALLAWREAPSAAAEPPTLAGSRPRASAPDESAPDIQANETHGAEPAAGIRPRPDHTLAFARLSRAVRQTIALEARIAAGDIASPRRHPRTEVPQARIRPAGGRSRWTGGSSIRRTMSTSTAPSASGCCATSRNGWTIDPEIEPEDIAAIADTLRRACNDLGIGLDPRRRSPKVAPDAGQANRGVLAPAPRPGPQPYRLAARSRAAPATILAVPRAARPGPALIAPPLASLAIGDTRGA